VIVGVEGTSRSRHTLEFAYRYAAVHELPLTVLHSHADLLGATGGVLVSATPRELEDEERLLAELVAGIAEKYPDVPLELKVTPGVPAEKLVRAAAKHHLVVVGRHGETEHGPTYLGGTSRAVVERAEAPVAVVPEESAGVSQPS
jgi:nucleotide-binding universal stress UspA family protein